MPPTTAPATKAVALAKSGVRYRLDSADVRPGCIAWIPWAGVIKVTHRDYHKGASDGVEVICDGASTSKGETKDEGSGRPRRRAWNHPCVIVRREVNNVWILGVTSFNGRTLDDKLAKYSMQQRQRIASKVVPIAPAHENILFKDGRKLYKSLMLEGGVRMAKEGYVKLDTVYKMDWRDLRRFDVQGKRKLMLDEDSTCRLVELTKGFAGSEWDGKIERASKKPNGGNTGDGMKTSKLGTASRHGANRATRKAKETDLKTRKQGNKAKERANQTSRVKKPKVR